MNQRQTVSVSLDNYIIAEGNAWGRSVVRCAELLRTYLLKQIIYE